MVTPAPKCRGSTTLALWTDPVDRGLHGCVRLAHDVRVTSSLGNLDPAPAVRSRAPGWRDPRLWIGVAIVAGHHEPVSVLATADAALYDAKAEGKGRVVVRDKPAPPRSGTWRKLE